jgi:hypothetical protein
MTALGYKSGLSRRVARRDDEPAAGQTLEDFRRAALFPFCRAAPILEI